ncbi:kinase-like domain-containing protein [Gigaspora rosea]|uniref:Kinase-like domain-containing protein n=1 Tax=Gigaspora rosea TaxID=44941 RepID=A0A397VMU1_9GLOM|nr:kinase-like domain-containing protein [Gigaspora rosea]
MANLQEWFGARKDLLLIKFDDLGQLTFIDRGAFGEVYSTQISSFGEKVAVKKVFKSYLGDSSTSKGFIKELKLHSQLEKHERIINFLGICEHPKEACFLLIIEFADGGTLRSFLAIEGANLRWPEKLILSQQLVEGLSFLHGKNIIHRDLHDKNVLIHQRKIKIADFGMSKNLNSIITSQTELFGMLPFVEPKVIKEPSYRRNEKSDIFSLGVLLWEISSCRPPFANVDQLEVFITVNLGRREIPVAGTPIAYVNLYQNCWQEEPNLRPVIKQVIFTLKSLPFEPTYVSSDEIFIFKNQDSITTENSSQFSMAVKTENNSFYGEYKCENHIKNNNWCHHCEVENFKQQFSNWTSNNSIINRSIRNLQLNFTKSFNDLKWIQFNRLINIKEHENATSILEAEWIDEPMDLWNKDYEKLGRSGSTKIVIKKSSEIADIINEVSYIRCFGLTHISGKQQYGIILPLASEGDLRKYMKKKFPLELKQELHVLQGIVNGLKSIHDLNYVHADIHPGNVVINVEMGDFGESRPVSARPQEINENMPFMAPEVIKGQGYTKTGDIYSLGMLMFEISFGHPPFIDRKYDVHLALDICNGLRPSFDPKLPKFYADLIVRCWNTDPSERPTINEVKQLIDSWCRNKK